MAAATISPCARDAREYLDRLGRDEIHDSAVFVIARLARDLDALLNEREATLGVLAERTTCPCRWCPECIERLSALAPDEMVEEAHARAAAAEELGGNG